MKKDNPFYFKQNRLIMGFLLLMVLISSCSKDLKNPTTDISPNTYLETAKQYSLSETTSYHFCNLTNTTKSQKQTQLQFNWDQFIFQDREHATAVEIPLYNETEKELYLEEFRFKKCITKGQFKSTTRLIVRRDKKTNIYEQFIVTKIWIGNDVKNIEKISFNDIENDAVTIIYDIAGNLITEYKKCGETYSILSLGIPYSTNYLRLSEEGFGSETVTTKVSDEDKIYRCLSCNKYGSSMTCPFCGKTCTMVIDEVTVAGEQKKANDIRNVLSIIYRHMLYGISQHERKCDRLCYGRLIKNVAQEYHDYLITRITTGLIHDLFYYTSETYDPNQISTNDALVLYDTYGESGVNRILNQNQQMMLFEAERACERACLSTPGDGGGGRGDGTGGGTPPPDPCTDTKCSDCGKCLNPSKGDCLSCVCQHSHGTCKMCHKCIKTGNDTCLKTKTSHTIACPTCECICGCGAEVNPETGMFECLEVVIESCIYKNANEGYLEMWKRSIKDGGEVSGAMVMDTSSSDFYLIAQYRSDNDHDYSQIRSYRCKDDPLIRYIEYPQGSIRDFRYNVWAQVHTHPTYSKDGNKLLINKELIEVVNNKKYLSYNKLCVSNEDISLLPQFIRVYILNEGNVYEVNNKDYYEGISTANFFLAEVIGNF